MRFNRLSYCLLAACLWGVFNIGSGQTDLKELQIKHSTARVEPLQRRGRWSKGVGDVRIDLTGKWNAFDAAAGELDTIVIPFCWNGKKQDLVVKRSFILPDSLIGRQWRLVVESFGQHLELTLNGAHLDTRSGDGSSFQLDIQPGVLRFDGSLNELVLKLDNRLSRHGEIPLVGNIFSRERNGGIFRDIYLLASPPTHIADVDAKRIRSDSDLISVQIGVRQVDDRYAAQSGDILRLKISILDDNDNLLYEEIDRSTVFQSGGVTYVKKLFPLPELKTRQNRPFESPTRYVIRSELTGSNFEHRMEVTHSVRPIDFISGVFSIGNQAVKNFRCVSYFDSHPETGVLTTRESVEAVVDYIESLGAHGVRVMQGPTNPLFLDQCEKRGLVVFEELPVFQVPDPLLADPNVILSAADQLETMINRDKQYACIGGWGIGSEINPPNAANAEYYRTLTAVVRRLDDRPVYASIPFDESFTADPLDFVILELTPYGKWRDKPLPEKINGDRPAMIGGIRQSVVSGRIGGWADRFSEAGQAYRIVEMVREVEQLPWCKGLFVGDLTDWQGAVASISSPTRGMERVYSTGLIDRHGQSRLAYRRLADYWINDRLQPLNRGQAPSDRSALLIVAGFALIFILFLALRQNHLFRLNLSRTFTSPRSFFQDVIDGRYFQTGPTILVAFMVSGALGLIGAGWLNAHRESYQLDWLAGFIFGGSELHQWVATLIWQPARGLLFFWGMVFVFMWIEAIRTALIFRFLKVKCSLSQGIDYVTWSMAGCLGLLPIGIVAERLFERSSDWFVLPFVFVILLWSLQRLISILKQHNRGPAGKVILLWMSGPVFAVIAIVVFIETTRNMSSYWSFFWGTIVQ